MAEPPAVEHRPQRHLPAVVRGAVAALLGALVAVLTSYLLRKIGF